MAAANDPNPGLRATLQSALSIVTPQVNDLQNFSQDVAAVLDSQLTQRIRRKQLIQNVLNALDQVVAALTALQMDGYPVLEQVDLSGITAAEQLFGYTEQPTGISLDLANVSLATQPRPTR